MRTINAQRPRTESAQRDSEMESDSEKIVSRRHGSADGKPDNSGDPIRRGQVREIVREMESDEFVRTDNGIQGV